MYKEYPYLQDSYIYYTDRERYKRNLLKDIEKELNQKQYIKIILLDWDENPLKEIQGEITDGSISKVGDSPVRRTANLSCAVDARSYSVEDGKLDFAINKKVFIEIGVKNETSHYVEYPIFWFPEGVFFIGSFAISSSAEGATTISLSLKDKMAMLNGDVGGKMPTTVILDSMDTQLPNGEYIEKKVLIYNIIKEVVNHYGGESLNRIVIEGVPLRIRRIMQWTGDEILYQFGQNELVINDTDPSYIYTLNKDFVPPEGYIKKPIAEFTKGDDIGYIMDDFVVSNELTAAPGESVTSILDKIKNILGNYEYFYDIFGTFHFREIKNYYVTTQARTLLDEMAENDYLVEVNNERSIFTFDDINLLTSINVTPQYENIKNDYIVEGKTQSQSGVSYSVRYHLAIDNKPSFLGYDERKEIYQLEDMSEEYLQLLDLTKIYNSKLKDLRYQLDTIEYKLSELYSIVKSLEKEWEAQDDKLYNLLKNRLQINTNKIDEEYTVSKDNQKYDINYGLTALLLQTYVKGIWNIQQAWSDKTKEKLIDTITSWYKIRIAIYENKKNIEKLEELGIEWAIIQEEEQQEDESTEPKIIEKISGNIYNAVCYYINDMIQIRIKIAENNTKIKENITAKTEIEQQISEYIQNIEKNEERKSLKDMQRGFNKISNLNYEKPYYGIYPSFNDDFSSLIFYEHPRGEYPTASFTIKVNNLPTIGNFNLIYEKDKVYYYWTGKEYDLIEPTAIYTGENSEYQYYATDWRTKLYLDGLRGVINGTDKGYYYEELAAFWPSVYDLKNQCFYGEKDSNTTYYKTLTIGTYYLDFLDALSTSVGEWSVNNIGRRSDIVVNDQINCLFQPEIPNVVIIPTSESVSTEDGWNALEEGRTISELKQEAKDNYYPWAQVDDEIYTQLLIGGYKNAAFDQIKYELYLYTRYQKAVSMNCIPVFYLEPNSRITINDSTTNTYGDFVIQSINITFGPGANMSVTCNETAERF